VGNLLWEKDGFVLDGKEGVNEDFIGASDGDLVGSRDDPVEGTSLGVWDDCLDGDSVNSNVSILGFTLGASLMPDEPVGAADGHFVGEVVGSFVNNFGVGGAVGGELGQPLGLALGAVDGNLDGISLGNIVGKDDGDNEQ